MKDRYLYRKDNAIDVLMLSLDAAEFLEKCLDSLYSDIPINKIIVCDGGSKDNTKKIFSKYPRVEFHEKSDIKTTGKGYEFLFSQCTTDWFALIDADVEIIPGWYNEMNKYREKYDFFECKRIMSYQFFRERPETIDPSVRSYSGCQMGRKEAFKTYHCDDDYIWRTADLYTHQHVVAAGWKYGKVATTYHYHHTGEGKKYDSDKEKSGSSMVFEEPKRVFIRNDAWVSMMRKHAKAIVKYLDPNFLDYNRNSVWLSLLDKKFIKEHNPQWMRYYKKPYPRILRKIIGPIKLSIVFTFKYILKYPLELKKILNERKTIFYQ